jgi:hypothetical protein
MFRAICPQSALVEDITTTRVGSDSEHIFERELHDSRRGSGCRRRRRVRGDHAEGFACRLRVQGSQGGNGEPQDCPRVGEAVSVRSKCGSCVPGEFPPNPVAASVEPVTTVSSLPDCATGVSGIVTGTPTLTDYGSYAVNNIVIPARLLRQQERGGRNRDRPGTVLRR